MNLRCQPRAADKGIADELDVAHLDLASFGDGIDNLGIAQLIALDEGARGEPAAHLLVFLKDLPASLLIEIGVEGHARPQPGEVAQLLFLDVVGPLESDLLDLIGQVEKKEEDFCSAGSVFLEQGADIAELLGFVQFADVLIHLRGIVLLAGLGAQANLDLLRRHPLVALDNHVADDDLPWRGGCLAAHDPAAHKQAQDHAGAAGRVWKEALHRLHG